MSTEAIQALLSPAAETWQSVHVFVSLPRTVCGTKGEKAVPAKPSAESVCCWEYTHSLFAFCEETRTAQAERTGETRRPVTVPSRPSMKTSVRRVWNE